MVSSSSSTSTTTMLRFKWWVIELVSSMIVTFSYIAYSRLDLEDEWSTKDRWIFIVSLLSIALSGLGIIASLLFPQTELIGSICRIESILVWCTVAMWSLATVTSIVGPFEDKSSVIDESYIVVHPNLYFFTLFCLIISILLIASWFQENIHTNDSKTTTQWILLGAMSFFVMISGITFRDHSRAGSVPIVGSGDGSDGGGGDGGTVTTMRMPLCDTDNYNCDRANLSILLGGISAGIACIVTPWRGTSAKCQTDISAILFLAWFISIWFLTFDSGPGRSWGNLYFGTWACLFLTLNILIVASTMDDISATNRQSQQRRRRSESGSVRIGRDDVWEVAYERLDMMTQWQPQTDNLGRVYRGDSCKAMFYPANEWPGLEDVLSNVPDHTNHDNDDKDGKVSRDVTTAAAATGSDRPSSPTTMTKQHHPHPAPLRIRTSQVRRLEKWSILIISTAVNLAAVAPTLPHNAGGITTDWLIIAIPSTSLVVSIFGFATCLRSSRMAKRIQTVSIVSSVILWTVALPLISVYTNKSILGYGNNDVTTLSEANLFFSTWFCLISSFLLATSWLNASVTSTDWVLVCIMSFALLGSSIAYLRSYAYNHDDDIDGNSTSTTTTVPNNITTDGDVDLLTGLHTCGAVTNSCPRVTFGFYLGLVSGCISLTMIPLYRLSPCFHLVVGIASLCGWGFGVAYITFATGHGASAGTIYFCCWSALFSSLDITTMNILLLVHAKEKRKAATHAVATQAVTEGEGVDVKGDDAAIVGPDGTDKMEEGTRIDPKDNSAEQPMEQQPMEQPIGTENDFDEEPLYDQELASESERKASTKSPPDRDEWRSGSIFYSAQELLDDDDDSIDIVM